MKALTMTQPWASLVEIGENTIETRSWSTRYRGPLAIHSARAFPREARELCGEPPYREALARHGYPDAESLPLGEIIAVATLEDVLAFGPSSLREVRARVRRGELPRHEADFGDFSPGRFGLVLSDVQRLTRPVPARGMLGVWSVPAALQASIRERLAQRRSTSR